MQPGQRLTATRDFTRIYRRGAQANSPNLRLAYLPANQNTSRFGFVVANKLARTLVERNRIKRRLRAETQRLLPHLKPGFQAVIAVRGMLGELSSREISRELEGLFKKTRLWQDF